MYYEVGFFGIVFLEIEPAITTNRHCHLVQDLADILRKMNLHQICIENSGNFVINEIKVKANDFVNKNQSIILLQNLQTKTLMEIRSEFSGKPIKIYKNVRDIVKKGDIIMDFDIEQSDEPQAPGLSKSPDNQATPRNDCGEDLLQALTINSETSKTSVSKVSDIPITDSIPEINLNLAQRLAKEDKQRLLKNRKLVLLVDLDQTLIHTTMSKSRAKIIPKDGISFQTEPKTPASTWYHTKLRPGTRDILENICHLFELYIVTFGTRSYADTIAQWLDPEQKYFSERILSRNSDGSGRFLLTHWFDNFWGLFEIFETLKSGF